MSVHRFTREGRAPAYVVRWREHGRNRSRSFPATKAGERAAHLFDAQLAERKDHGAFAIMEPSRMLATDWLERWMDVYGPGWEASTLRQRGGLLDHDIAPALNRVRLRDLGRARVQELRRDLLAAGRTPRTVNAAIRVLSAALGAAVEEGLIPFNPCLRLRTIPQPPVERQAVHPEVVEALRCLMPTKQDRLIVSLLAYAGLRPGELVELRPEDVGEASLHVARAAREGGGVKTTKTGHGRVVPIRREVRRDLPIEDDGDQEAYLIATPRGGRLDWHNWTARAWTPARDVLAGFDPRARGAVPYGCRHTYASLLIAEGHSVVEVAAWMGHAKPSTTLGVYSHLFSMRDEERT